MSTTIYTHPEYLVETEWLEHHLHDDNVKIFDCSIAVKPNPDKSLSNKIPFVFESLHDNYYDAHIPNAGYIDIATDLSDSSAKIPLMIPTEKQFSQAMSDYGIGNNCQVIIYSTTEQNWAARFWCMLREFGFTNAAILNGGWKKWQDEKRPVSNQKCVYQTANFTAQKQTTMFVDKNTVLTAVSNKDTILINALPAAIHNGESDIYFGRRGRISNSVNIPFMSLLDSKTGSYLPENELRKLFDTVNVDDAEKIITYCGAGVGSSNTAFTLALLGYDNIEIYDGSMIEWGNDPSLPMELSN